MFPGIRCAKLLGQKASVCDVAATDSAHTPPESAAVRVSFQPSIDGHSALSLLEGCYKIITYFCFL